MAESEYIRPTVDPLSGVSEGINIFERLQRIKQVEADGRREAERLMLDRATSAHNLEVAQFKIKSAKADWELKQNAAAKWASDPSVVDELNRIDVDHANNPIQKMKAYAELRARRAYAVGIPEAKAEMDALLMPREGDSQLEVATAMANQTVKNYESAEKARELDPAHEYEENVNIHIGKRWVKTGRPNREAMRAARKEIYAAKTLEELSALQASDAVMLMEEFEETQTAIRAQAGAIIDAGKRALADRQEERATTQADLTAEKTRGDIETQNLSRREKLQEMQTLAVEGDAKIREMTEALKNPKELEKLVGPIDGTGFMKAFNTMFRHEVRAGQFKLEQIINIELLGKTKFLRPISEDELMFLKTTVPSMRDPVEVWIPWLTDLKQIREDAGRDVPVQEKYRGFATTGSLSGMGAPSSGKAKVMELLDQRGKK